jgi:putative copper resistance protein D
VTARPPSAADLFGVWSADPALIAALAALAALYVAAVLRTRGSWPVLRTASFLAGVGVAALAFLSGIDAYADRLLSVHMVQHMLLLVVVPVLLLSGAPVRLALAAGGRRGRRRMRVLLHSPAIRIASRPAFGVGLFCAVVLATHLTGFFELALRNGTVHELEHAAYVGAGLVCFAPLLAVDPLPRPPGPLARFAWLMLVMTVMTVVGAVLAFAPTLRYPYYLGPARTLHVSALADQHLAGVVMWVGGGVLGSALMLIVVMRALLEEERRQQRRDRYAAASVFEGAPERVLR